MIIERSKVIWVSFVFSVITVSVIAWLYKSEPSGHYDSQYPIYTISSWLEDGAYRVCRKSGTICAVIQILPSLGQELIFGVLATFDIAVNSTYAPGIYFFSIIPRAVFNLSIVESIQFVNFLALCWAIYIFSNFVFFEHLDKVSRFTLLLLIVGILLVSSSAVSLMNEMMPTFVIFPLILVIGIKILNLQHSGHANNYDNDLKNLFSIFLLGSVCNYQVLWFGPSMIAGLFFLRNRVRDTRPFIFATLLLVAIIWMMQGGQASLLHWNIGQEYQYLFEINSSDTFISFLSSYFSDFLHSIFGFRGISSKYWEWFIFLNFLIFIFFFCKDIKKLVNPFCVFIVTFLVGYFALLFFGVLGFWPSRHSFFFLALASLIIIFNFSAPYFTGRFLSPLKVVVCGLVVWCCISSFEPTRKRIIEVSNIRLVTEVLTGIPGTKTLFAMDSLRDLRFFLGANYKRFYVKGSYPVSLVYSQDECFDQHKGGIVNKGDLDCLKGKRVVFYCESSPYCSDRFAVTNDLSSRDLPVQLVGLKLEFSGRPSLTHDFGDFVGSGASGVTLYSAEIK